ncbi:GAL4, partial [Geosmithia morbida]
MTSMSPASSTDRVDHGSPNRDAISPRLTASPKNVAFELLFVDAPQYRARLPMRVQIYPHDTTDSIVTTVKNFYGLYSGPTGSKGVSFEDKDGNTLIARYENFTNQMVVYVRVFEEYPAEPVAYGGGHHHHQAHHNGQGYAASAPGGSQAYHHAGGAYSPTGAVHQSPNDVSRPASRTSRHRSRSPGSSRGDSAGPGPKRRSRSVKDSFDHMAGGYSSDEGAPSTSSARLKDHLGNTDISVDNIVEGGRRKRAKFESSELPLFAPPQMPAATSNPSVSPARRIDHHRPSPGFAHPGHNPFTNPRPMHSSSHGYSSSMHGHHHMYTPHHGRSRSSAGIVGLPGSADILPTPDPTVGSCVSEEDKDVALQLMRLGDMSNVSHGRTSASTLDDALSGKAEVASSTGATSDGESDGGDGDVDDDDDDYGAAPPPARRQKLTDGSGPGSGATRTPEGRSALPTSSTFGAPDPARPAPKSSSKGTSSTSAKVRSLHPKTKTSAATATAAKSSSSSNRGGGGAAQRQPSGGPKKQQLPTTPAGGRPMSPASGPPSRKHSTTSASPAVMMVRGSAAGSASGAAGAAEDDQPDLSTKPRCQRCRKSKKGCDRQRPCGRCRDAGLSAEQCISEDEGNGRKGRYGRHMGVPIKKEDGGVGAPPTSSVHPGAGAGAGVGAVHPGAVHGMAGMPGMS